ncbi:AMP dependent ligase/synthetase [Entamoeba marina]
MATVTNHYNNIDLPTTSCDCFDSVEIIKETIVEDKHQLQTTIYDSSISDMSLRSPSNCPSTSSDSHISKKKLKQECHDTTLVNANHPKSSHSSSKSFSEPKKKRFSIMGRSSSKSPSSKQSKSLNPNVYNPSIPLPTPFTSLTQEQIDLLNSYEYEPDHTIASYYAKAKARKDAVAFIEDNEHITWRKYISLTNKFAKVFISTTQPITICMRNCVDAYAAAFAAALVKCPIVFVSPTTSPFILKGILTESDSNVVIYDHTTEFLIKDISSSFPHVAFCYRENPKKFINPIGISFKELFQTGITGTKAESKDVQQRKNSITPNDVLEYCFVPGKNIYYSGTLWTNGAVCSEIDNLLQAIDIKPGAFIVSYLPQSFYMERIISLYMHIAVGFRVVIAQPSAMSFDCKDLFKILKLYEPTFFLGIPRVYEKISRVLDTNLSRGSVNKIMKAMSKCQSETYSVSSEEEDMRVSTPRKMSRKYLVKKSKEITGLKKCENLLCVGADLDAHIIEILASVDLFVHEGLSFVETTGFCVLNTPLARLRGSQGKPIGVDVAIENNELCISGPTVSPGYTNPKLNTQFGENGFHSCWKSSFVQDAQTRKFIQTTSQLDDFIITSGAEQIYPLAMEDIFRRIPTIKECLIVGHGYRNISLFILVDEVLVKKLLKENCPPLNELSKNIPYCSYLTKRIQVANTYFPRPHQVKRFALFIELPELERGKHKTINGRFSVYKKYESYIKALSLLKPTY